MRGCRRLIDSDLEKLASIEGNDLSEASAKILNHEVLINMLEIATIRKESAMREPRVVRMVTGYCEFLHAAIARMNTTLTPDAVVRKTEDELQTLSATVMAKIGESNSSQIVSALSDLLTKGKEAWRKTLSIYS